MSAYRPLFVDAEAAIDAERCRCRVLCMCPEAWAYMIEQFGPLEPTSPVMVALHEARLREYLRIKASWPAGLTLGLSDLVD